MNCANHQQTPAAAFCRTCGKPLCTNCTRPVMGVIYCENCLAEKVAGTTPPAAAYQPAPGYQGPVHPVSTGPNPALAGILSIFPGIGAVYSGLYVKGLVHLVIFVLLIVGASHANSDAMGTIFGLLLSGFYIYQIIDAVKSAKAIQAGQPVPDPFGLSTMFSPGSERMDFTRGVPTGALVLIGLGVIFLLDNLDIPFLKVGMMWPLILIALGVWLFAKRKACNDRGDYRHRSFAGPAVLITLGVVFFLDNLHDRWYGVPGWGRTWPVILLVIGVIKLMERSGGGPYTPVSGPPPGGDVLPPPQPPSEVDSEVKNNG